MTTQTQDQEWLDPWHYNSEAGIDRNLKIGGLGGLHLLAKRRRDAGYTRREQLTKFIVLGQWFLDESGNFSRLTLETKLSFNKTVVRADDLFSLVSMKYTCTLGYGPRFPSVDAKCEICGDGWTLNDAHLFEAQKVRSAHVDTYAFYHTACWKLHRLASEHEHFTEIFRNAGFKIAVLTATENKYTDESWGRPWFYVDTMVGRFLIGWRKRVINIDWSNTKKDLSTLFEDVQDTKGPDHIHAYSPEKASEYLCRIRAAMEPATAKTFEIWSEFDVAKKYGDRVGAGMKFGASRGVDFKDACKSFFANPENDPYRDYSDYWNTFNGWELYPSEDQAKVAKPPAAKPA